MSWAAFWGLLLIAAVLVFAVLAVFVTIGGFRDVFSLFRGIDAKHQEHDAKVGKPPSAPR